MALVQEHVQPDLYRLSDCGNRIRTGLASRRPHRPSGGGPGLDVPPKCIVIAGPYRYTRNPMYLGHLIFMTGLALSFNSWLAVALLAFHAVWFHRRVLKDEAGLESRFGSAYLAYKSQVK